MNDYTYFMLSSLFIYLGGLLLLFNFNLLFLVIGFELMLVGSLFLLKLTTKTERAAEAIFEMFVWSIVGSVLLFVGLVLYYISFFGLIVIYSNVFLMLGFFVKVPLWPFTSWLLKAHVEASTEFSIFLSGFLVKFGVLGIFNLSSYFLYSTFFWGFIYFCSIIGIIDASIRLLAQVDLKRIVALTTVIETNWLLLNFSYNTLNLIIVANWLIVFHCITTTMEFYLVESLYKRYGSRNILNISSLSYNYPSIYRILVIVTLSVIGLPGTSIFIAKASFFITLVSIDLVASVLIGFIFFLYLPIFFVRVFLIISGGSANVKSLFIYDMSTKEFLIFFMSILLTIVLGFYPLFIA